MNEETAIKTLAELGLTHLDAQVYLLLGKKGPKKGRELLATLKINRQQLYRSLKSLQSKGMVNSTIERPARFSSIPSEQVLDMVIKNKVNEATQLQHRRTELLSILQSAEIKERTDTPAKFTVIEGEKYIFTKIGQMVKDTRQHIWISASGLSIIQAEKAEIIKNTIELKVPFKLLTNVTAKNLSIVEKARDQIVDPEKCIGKHIYLEENFFPKFVIRDDDEMIFLISKEGTISDLTNDVGLWTNSKPLIDAFKTFFNVLWRDAMDIGKRIGELNTGETLPETIFIRDPEEAYQKFLTLINSAQNEVVLMTSAEGLKNILDQKQILNNWKKRNVAVRVMAPITKENEAVGNKLSKYCSVRHVQFNYLGEVVVDNKQLLMFKTALPTSNGSVHSAFFDNSLFTNDPEYVLGRRELLDELWSNSPGIVEELKRSEARFRSLFESSFDAILLTKPDGSILSANPAACRLFGLTEEEIQKTGRNGLVVMDKRAAGVLLNSEKTGKEHSEITLRRKDGSTFEGEVTSSLFTDADGIAKTSMIIRDITERKKSEEIARKSEVWKATSLYARNLIEASLDPLVTIDAKGKITDANKATEDVTGYTKDQLIGSDFSSYFAEPQKAKVGYKQVFANSIVKNLQLAMKHKSGKITDVLYNATVFRNAEGQVQGIFAAARDITERVNAEKILQKKEQELNCILDSTPTIIFYKDREGKVIQANRAFAEALKTTKEKLLGKTVFDLYSVEIAQGMTNDDIKVYSSKSPNLGRVEPYESPTGLRWLRTDKIPIFDENGVVNGLIGFSEDITERKLAEEALRSSERLYSELFNSMAEMFFVVAPLFDDRGKAEDFIYVEANPEFLKSIGKTLPQVAGKSSKQLFGYVDSLWLDIFSSMTKTGQPVHVENYSKITNRYYKIYAWKINNKRLGVLCEDITRHKDIERQLQDNERLAAIGQTAGMVGHDLRNPLQTIIGHVYLAETELKSIPDSENKSILRESIQAIANQTSYMNKIVSDLQNFAKPVAAQRQIVNLSHLMIALLAQVKIQKNIQTAMHVNEKLTVNADPELLRRVFINLMTNALQAMPKGGELTISAERIDIGQVQISFEDTGLGIPEEIRTKIFMPLFTTKPMGQGFGLAVCKRLVEAQGGHISFESEVGRGSKFKVNLPA